MKIILLSVDQRIDSFVAKGFFILAIQVTYTCMSESSCNCRIEGQVAAVWLSCRHIAVQQLVERTNDIQ
jgi:hypothetical protein